MAFSWHGVEVMVYEDAVARHKQDLNPLFVHSEEFSHSLNRNDANLAWHPLPVPTGDEALT